MVFLDHGQNVHIHAVRANILMSFSVDFRSEYLVGAGDHGDVSGERLRACRVQAQGCGGGHGRVDRCHQKAVSPTL